jgi:hypothetical protein
LPPSSLTRRRSDTTYREDASRLRTGNASALWPPCATPRSPAPPGRHHLDRANPAAKRPEPVPIPTTTRTRLKRA